MSDDTSAHDSPVPSGTPESTSIRAAAQHFRDTDPGLAASKSTIHRRLHEEGQVRPLVVGLDGKSYPSSREDQRAMARAVLTMRDQGFTQREIAAALPISPRTVSRMLRKWRWGKRDAAGEGT